MGKKRLSLDDLHVFTARFPGDVWGWLEKSADVRGTTINAELVRMLRGLRDDEPTGRKPRRTRRPKADLSGED